MISQAVFIAVFGMLSLKNMMPVNWYPRLCSQIKSIDGHSALVVKSHTGRGINVTIYYAEPRRPSDILPAAEEKSQAK
jgi:hypothetical protein